MKKEFNLTGKIYTIEFLSGMIFYVIGVFLVTPATNPIYVKYLGIGSLAFIQLIFIIQMWLKKSEKIDERAKLNIHKASHVTIQILWLLFLLIGIIFSITSIKIYVTSAIISFVLATVLVIHACIFRMYELSGN